MCKYHHHRAAHDPKIRLVMEPDGTLHITYADGTTETTIPPIRQPGTPLEPMTVRSTCSLDREDPEIDASTSAIAEPRPSRAVIGLRRLSAQPGAGDSRSSLVIIGECSVSRWSVPAVQASPRSRVNSVTVRDCR